MLAIERAVSAAEDSTTEADVHVANEPEKVETPEQAATTEKPAHIDRGTNGASEAVQVQAPLLSSATGAMCTSRSAHEQRPHTNYTNKSFWPHERSLVAPYAT